MRVYRGYGFIPFYRFCFSFENWQFEKSFNYDFTTCIDNNEGDRSMCELHTLNKTEFVNKVYEFINEL